MYFEGRDSSVLQIVDKSFMGNLRCPFITRQAITINNIIMLSTIQNTNKFDDQEMHG